MASLYLVERKGADIAAAATLVLPAVGDRFDVTGSASVTACQTSGRGVGARVLLRFAAACTLTHGANLALRAAANYTTTAGDELLFEVTGTNQVAQVVLANNAVGAGTGGVLQAVALDDVATSSRLGVRATGGGTIENISDPTSNAIWKTAVDTLSEYTRAFLDGSVASAASLWNGALLLNLKAAGAPPALEVRRGQTDRFNPATPGATVFTIAGSGDIVAGNATSAIQAVLRALGGVWAALNVSGTSVAAASAGVTASGSDRNDGFNGLYVESGTSNGRAKYENPGAVQARIAWSGTRWEVLQGASDVYYYTDTGGTTPPDVVWTNVSAFGTFSTVYGTGGPAELDLVLGFPASSGTVTAPNVTGAGGTAGYSTTTAAGAATGVTVTQV